MNTIKKIFVFAIFIFISLHILSCKENENSGSVSEDFGHPRILLLEGEENQIRDLINSDDTWQKVHFAILEESNKILSRAELERNMIGRRLLSTSRELLRRVFFLSYAFRMTGETKFLDKAEKEMLSVSGFSDWNPSHFLDVAEMTMGMGIGYDWLFIHLSESSREIIKSAIVNKGLKPSLESSYNSWLRGKNNWNQVCNAGMTFGAMAVQEDFPELSKQIIDRAVGTISLPMEAYKPDGVYPEGYSYWGYGTTFNVLFLSALEKLTTEDNGLAQTAGFLETAHFLKHMITPTGGNFTWGDCGTGTNLQPAMFWFAGKTGNPSALWSEKQFLELDDFSKFKGIRELPALMIWGKNIPLHSISEPPERFWFGQGYNPVAMMRSDWTSQAVYLGFKAGSPSVNHGHMDIGSFVVEADGRRWATDLGMQNYESLESLGMKIFGKEQDAERWTIFRMNTFSHNVLIFDEQQQRVNGYAKIDRTSDSDGFMFAVSDISSLYSGQANQVVRGVALLENNYVLIRDEFETLDKTTKVRWQMVTGSNVQLGNREATLTNGGKIMKLKVQGPETLQMKTWSTAPTNNYDAQNPGTIIVGFECEIAANSREFFEVVLIPETMDNEVVFLNKTLEEW